MLPDCPPPYYALAHSMGGAVMLRVAHAGKRWFDRIVLSAPMIDLPGYATKLPTRMLVRSLRWLGMGGNYVPGGNSTLVNTAPFVNNPVTSDPCAMRAIPRSMRKTRRWASRRRRSRGPTPRSRR